MPGTRIEKSLERRFIGSINIKGKTGENLSDPIGRKAAIAVHAVALVKRKK